MTEEQKQIDQVGTADAKLGIQKASLDAASSGCWYTSRICRGKQRATSCLV